MIDVTTMTREVVRRTISSAKLGRSIVLNSKMKSDNTFYDVRLEGFP